MENLQKLKQELDALLDSHDVKVFELNWLSSQNTLQVCILKKDHTIDLDTCAFVSEIVSDYLDQHDQFSNNYMLEVCSPGAEREIKDLSELKSLDKPYVFVRLTHPVNKVKEVTGTVLLYDETILTLEYQDKARKKQIQIPIENVEFIRFAVKI